LAVPVEAFRATVEGTFVKGLDRRTRRELLAFALERPDATREPIGRECGVEPSTRWLQWLGQ
jgi:hypothetical protein